MQRNFRRALAAFGMAVIATPSLTHAQQSRGADVVVVKEESVVKFVSCEPNLDLVSGRIVIKNVGDESGLRGFGGNLTEFVRVYAPCIVDFSQSIAVNAVLEPFEAAAVEFAIGRGKIKRGRLIPSERCLGPYGGGSSPTPSPQPLPPAPAPLPPIGDISGPVSIYALSRSEVREIQRALQALRYYRASIDGIYGRATRRGMRRFARSQALSAPGVYLQRRLLRRLESQSGVSISAIYNISGRDCDSGSTDSGDGCYYVDSNSRYLTDYSSRTTGGRRNYGEQPRRLIGHSEFDNLRGYSAESFDIDIFVEVDPTDRIENEENEYNNLARFKVRVENCGPNRPVSNPSTPSGTGGTGGN